VVNGPAPRRLPALPLKIVDGAPVVAGGFVGRPGFESGGGEIRRGVTRLVRHQHEGEGP
jgi:hypothetical protein